MLSGRRKESFSRRGRREHCAAEKCNDYNSNVRTTTQQSHTTTVPLPCLDHRSIRRFFSATVTSTLEQPLPSAFADETAAAMFRSGHRSIRLLQCHRRNTQNSLLILPEGTYLLTGRRSMPPQLVPRQPPRRCQHMAARCPTCRLPISVPVYR